LTKKAKNKKTTIRAAKRPKVLIQSDRQDGRRSAGPIRSAVFWGVLILLSSSVSYLTLLMYESTPALQNFVGERRASAR
jgi:hypothetical protein